MNNFLCVRSSLLLNPGKKKGFEIFHGAFKIKQFVCKLLVPKNYLIVIVLEEKNYIFY